MKKKTRISALCLMLALAAMLLVSCGGSAGLKRLEPKEGVEKVKLEGSCTAEITGETLRINFSSNLQEGAVVKFSVDSYEGKELASKEYSVSGENIYAEFAIEPEWEGVLYGTVQCSPQVGSQPSEVTDLYGNYFQNIDGEHVIWNDKSNIFLVQSEKINLG